MQKRDIVVVGASAGGIVALRELVKYLPEDFKGSVFVVVHIPPYSESALPEILSKAGPLEAVHPKDGERIEEGKIYVAPNDHHLILDKNKVLVKKGPKENRFRPSIDALFRSAAYEYGSRVVGIIMSGILNDGASGMWTIKRLGGLAIVQDPRDAEQPQLPQNVMEYVNPDYVLAAADMAPVICGLVAEPAPQEQQQSEQLLERLKTEVLIASRDNAFEMGIMNMGEFTPFTCPECHGALVRLVEDNIIRYRCHTGHAYTASSLLSEVSESVEGALWQSMRGLEEMSMLLNNIGDVYDQMNRMDAAALFRNKAEENTKRARSLHDYIFTQRQYSEDIRLNKEPEIKDKV
jgi:two-component system chemotaxis response regulator CheB